MQTEEQKKPGLVPFQNWKNSQWIRSFHFPFLANWQTKLNNWHLLRKAWNEQNKEQQRLLANTKTGFFHIKIGAKEEKNRIISICAKDEGAHLRQWQGWPDWFKIQDLHRWQNKKQCNFVFSCQKKNNLKIPVCVLLPGPAELGKENGF